jgi:hypothetical protein
MAGPENFLDADGNRVVVEERDIPAAIASGLHRERSDEQIARVDQQVDAERYGGIGGAAAALGAGALRGISFGLSDVALAGLGGEDVRADLAGLRRENPVTSTVGEIGGAVIPAFFSGGATAAESGGAIGSRLLASTPAGIGSRIATGGYEAGRAIGGLRGAATVAAAAGAEGALQSGGAYISDVALGDRELTAEGLSGALGHGFAFGAAGGAALYGIERGTIAARRLFSRPAKVGDDAAEAARVAWEQESERIIEANDAAADAARAQLDAARVARQEADIARQEASARLVEARARPADVIETEIPKHDALSAHLDEIGADYITQDVSARDIAKHGWYSPPRHDYESRVEILRREARPDEIIRLGVTPSGKIVASAGPEALDAASRNGQAVRVRWTTGFEPTPQDVLRGPPAAARAAADEAEKSVRAAAEEARLAAERQLVDGVKNKIANREIPGFLGPYTEQGLEDAAKQVIARQSADEAALAGAVKEYDEAKAALEHARKQTSDSLPSYKSVVRRTKKIDEVETVVSARDIAERGYFQPEAGFGVDSVRVGKARRAIAEGQDTPVRLSIAPSGKIQVTDGRHRLAAAVETGSDIRVKWSTSGEPSEDLVFRAPGGAAFPAPAEAGGGSLLDQLSATKRQIDQGAEIGDLGKAARRQTSTSDLEQQHERALALAESAPDPATKRAHLAAAADLERQLDGVGASQARNVVDDIAHIAPLITRYERAAAAIAEAAGDAAPAAARDAAAAFRRAEDETDRKFTDRVTRSIDDTAAENSLASPEGRIARARAEKLSAEARLARARAAETEAGLGAKAASKAAKEARRSSEASKPATPEPAIDDESLFAELAGFPGAHALPVIGPMLARYSQSKVTQALVTRFAGRVPATGSSRAAALAARVRTRIADAVDRSLGLIESSVTKSRPVVVAANEILARKIYDDGHPPPNGEGIGKLAAVRAREISAAAANPEAVIAQVRRELRDIHDPDLITAAEQHRIALIKHLNEVAPKVPPANPYAPVDAEVSSAAALKFARQIEAAFDPASVFEALHRQTLTIEAAETLRATSPKLFEDARQRLADRSADIKKTVQYRQRLLNGLLFDAPIDRSLEPETFAILQSAYSAPSGADGAASSTGNAPPAPSIANPIDLTTLYQTAADRRAIAR